MCVIAISYYIYGSRVIKFSNIKDEEEFFLRLSRFFFFLHTRSVQVLSSICTPILNFVAFFVVSQLFFFVFIENQYVPFENPFDSIVDKQSMVDFIV